MIYDEMREEELIMLLEHIEDPRKKRGVRFPFSQLLIMCIYAVLAGYSEAMDMVFYCELNAEYFKERFGIEKIPSHDTISRVLRMIDFTQLSDSLGNWLSETFPDICERYLDKKVLHVDGKAIRAASEKRNGEAPKYIMNAMYEGESINVKVKNVAEKENELATLPRFLELFNLKDTIVTIDAIGCNKKVIEAITKQEGNYVLPVKENQKKLLRTINDEIKRLEECGEYEGLEHCEKISKNHGRGETITAHMIKNTTFIYELLGNESFYGTIARIGIIDKRIVSKKEGEDIINKTRSIVITNLENMDCETMLKIKMAHWNIEMQHYILDVQLYEDRKTARIGNAMINGSILRRFCMAIRKHDERYGKLPMKRFLMANEHDIHRIEGLLFGNTEKL